ncbi:MAG: VWA domain-containing protein [Deltaproteobacteria bacterium]|nr:VWA domain-containing protein [Deltaproteobacteria bacterium]
MVFPVLACGGDEWGDDPQDAACGPDTPCAEPLWCSAAGRCIKEGTCLVDEDCEAGMLCDAQNRCIPASGRCGRSVAVPPDFLIVLDRSCSMQPALGQTTKWGAAVEATVGLVENYRGRLRFGLILFPDTEKPNCDQQVTHAALGDANEDAVKNLLQAALDPADGLFPDGPCVTNIDTAMSRASLEMSTPDGRSGFVLLVTDGVQSEGCGGDAGDVETEKVIAELYARDVSTFVVGFTAKADGAQLDKFARAGGRPNDDPEMDYYLAEDQAGLSAVLDTIARSTLECGFALGSSPPCSGEVYVFFKSGEEYQSIAGGGSDGWTLDPTMQKIIFSGTACSVLSEGLITEAHVVFGLGCGSSCQGPQ